MSKVLQKGYTELVSINLQELTVARKVNDTPKKLDTISALWRLMRVILDTLDFNEVAQEIVDSLLTELNYFELGYRIIVLALVDENKKYLKRISLSNTKEAAESLKHSPIPFRQIDIPLSAATNLCVKVLKSQKPAVAKRWNKILSPPLKPKVVDQIQKLVGIKTSLVYPIVFRGETIGVLIFSLVKNISDVTEEEWDLIKGFAVLVGIAVQNSTLYTQVEQQKTKLQIANEKLKELDKLKDEFISLTSHELKTPMTSILGYLWMILNGRAGKIPKTTREYLEKAFGSAKRQVKLVDDMLDVSRIERGTIEIAPEPTKLVEIVNEAIDEVRPQAKEKSLSIKIIGPDHKLPLVMVDKNRLKEIIINLVGNAIKYTQKGGVTVSFNQDNGFVETAIADTGVGIAKEDMPKLFTKFGRLGSSLTSLAETSGTGLGLYLTKKLVELHKGKIWAGSEVGKGSTFTFSLPVAK